MFCEGGSDVSVDGFTMPLSPAEDNGRLDALPIVQFRSNEGCFLCAASFEESDVVVEICFEIMLKSFAELCRE